MYMNSSEEVARKLDALWQTYLPTMLSRLASIRAAVESMEAGRVDEELTAKGAHDAHKLAGSLGTFGLASTSAMSAKIENLLSEPVFAAQNTAELRRLLESITRDIERH